MQIYYQVLGIWGHYVEYSVCKQTMYRWPATDVGVLSSGFQCEPRLPFNSHFSPCVNVCYSFSWDWFEENLTMRHQCPSYGVQYSTLHTIYIQFCFCCHCMMNFICFILCVIFRVASLAVMGLPQYRCHNHHWCRLVAMWSAPNHNIMHEKTQTVWIFNYENTHK